MRKKKSRSTKKQRGKAAASDSCRSSTAITPSNSSKILDESGNSHPSDLLLLQTQRNETEMEIPMNGWVVEREEATKAVRREQSDENMFRLARAFHKLREFEKLRKFVSRTKHIELKYREALSRWVKDADDYLNQPTLSFEKLGLKRENEKVWSVNLDRYSVCKHKWFKKMKLIHFAALHGDIRLLEKMVALGASIELPVANINENFEGKLEPAPAGVTPLLMALLAFLDGSNKALDCAVQLVRLGANCNVRLELDDSFPIQAQLHRRGWNGKTVFEIASLIDNPGLFNVIKQYEPDEANMRLVHCRCGSRLPWKQCHAATKAGPYIVKDRDTGERSWLYSPVAKCHCSYTNKKHYNCCWQDNSCFLFDSTGLLTMTYFRSREGTEMRYGKYGSDHPNVTNCIEGLRRRGMTAFLQSIDPEGNSSMGKWDIEVFTGTMERLEFFFIWFDAHWTIPKAELIQQAKQWNDALEKFCDDKKLAEAERDKVVEIHRASPFAPCANPPCKQIEAKVKSFSKCSRCNKMAYCSRKCQAAHWKSRHKERCHPVPSLPEFCFAGARQNWTDLGSSCNKATSSDCEILEQILPSSKEGEENRGTAIGNGLKNRSNKRRIHELCYYQAGNPTTSTLIRIRRIIQSDPSSVQWVDELGVTPFHIRAMSAKPSLYLFSELLKTCLPELILKSSVSGRISLHYLCLNGSSDAVPLIKIVLQATVLERLLWLGVEGWRLSLSKIVDSFHGEAISTRTEQVGELLSKLGKFERMEVFALLEQTAWKIKIDESSSAVHTDDESSRKRTTADRQTCRINCGADIIISNILPFLGEVVTLDFSFGTSLEDDDEEGRTRWQGR